MVYPYPSRSGVIGVYRCPGRVTDHVGEISEYRQLTDLYFCG
jgi:hypothetical protein